MRGLAAVQGLVISLLGRRSLLDHNQNIQQSWNIVTGGLFRTVLFRVLPLDLARLAPDITHCSYNLTGPANLICGHPTNDLSDVLRPTFLAQFRGMFWPRLLGVGLTLVDTEHLGV